MPKCPACFGQGRIDCRDDDAYLGEHWTDEQIRDARAAGMKHPVGIIECPECEGAAVVSKSRAREIEAEARAMVERAMNRARILGLA